LNCFCPQLNFFCCQANCLIHYKELTSVTGQYISQLNLHNQPIGFQPVTHPVVLCGKRPHL
jgi:hypothetical protein